MLGPKAALAGATEGLLVVDRAGTFTYANPAAERIVGVPVDKIVGSPLAKWTTREAHGQPLPDGELPVQRVLRTGDASAVAEHIVERPDGSTAVVSHTATVVRNDGGVIEGAVVALLDLTARRPAAENVEPAKDAFRAFIERSPDGVLLHRGGRLVYINGVLLQTLGYGSADEIVGRAVLDFVHPDDTEAVRERIRQVMEEGKYAPVREERLIRRDGKPIEAAVSALPINYEGEPTILVMVIDVSEHKRIQRELDGSVSILRATLESTADGLLVVDAQGRITAYNEKFIEMWRMPRDIMETRDDHRLLSFVLDQLDDPDAFVESTRGVYADAACCSQDVLRLTDGRTYERYSQPQRIDGKCVGRVWSFRDISARRRAEAEREQALAQVAAKHELLQTVINHAPVAICLRSGPDLVYELVNPAYQAIFGEAPRLGRALAADAPEVAPVVRPVLEHVLATGEPYRAVDVPYRFRRTPDGAVEDAFFWVNYRRVVTSKGPAVLALIVETTEQVRARKRIEALAAVAQRQAAELQHIHSSMADSVIVCDAGGHITHVNEAETRLTGVRSSDVLERSLEDYAQIVSLRHLDATPLAAEELPLARALSGETVMSAQFWSERSGRKVYMRSNAVPIRDAAGEIVGAVAVERDVSSMIEFDMLKDQFIRVAAHELKTPVAIMKGYADLLLRSTEQLPAALTGSLEAIERGASRIDRLVADLLDVSQLQLGRMEIRREKLDLSELVDVVTRRVALIAKKHQITIVDSEPVVVQADRTRIERVLDKLLDNAVRYSPRGGPIEVNVRVRDGGATVCVRDHGVGIARVKQDRIFERFYRAHTDTPHDYGGMGVGLYISREIIAQHGGTMSFRSQEGEGSEFCFNIPVKT